MKKIFNNEYDYSNILSAVEYVTFLVEYCDRLYKQFKEEYKEYKYKKTLIRHLKYLLKKEIIFIIAIELVAMILIPLKSQLRMVI